MNQFIKHVFKNLGFVTLTCIIFLSISSTPANAEFRRPFLLSDVFGQYQVVIQRSITPEMKEAVWKMSIQDLKVPAVETWVESDEIDDELQRKIIEKRIKSFVSQGALKTFTPLLVDKLSPLLKEAAQLSGESREQKLEEADTALLNYLKETPLPAR